MGPSKECQGVLHDPLGPLELAALWWTSSLDWSSKSRAFDGSVDSCRDGEGARSADGLAERARTGGGTAVVMLSAIWGRESGIIVEPDGAGAGPHSIIVITAPRPAVTLYRHGVLSRDVRRAGARGFGHRWPADGAPAHQPAGGRGRATG